MNGDAAPTAVSWVATTGAAASPVFGGPVGEPDEMIYVLELPGQFTSPAATPSGRVITGTYIVLALDAETMTQLAYGIRQRPMDLAMMGTAETDSLTSVPPGT